MEKFKVKKKHIVGELEGFPKHIVQLMVEEQVNQGNVANPSVFTTNIHADKSHGGFTWKDTELGHDLWADVINRKQFHRIPKPEKPKGHVHAKLMKQYAKDAKISETPWEFWEFRVKYCGKDIGFQPCTNNPSWLTATEYRRKSEADTTPALTPHEIIKAMLDKGMTVWAAISDESYDDARTRINKHIHSIAKVVGGKYPIQTDSSGWRFAVPVNTATMTEITELP